MLADAHRQRKLRSLGPNGRALIARSFLPFAARFLYRHPTRLRQLREYWLDYNARYGMLASLTGTSTEQAEAILYHLECLDPHFQEVTRTRGAVDLNHIIAYALVRLMRPEIMVETGVHEGWSAWFTLLAMEHNGNGVLHSIDLPNQDGELTPGGPRQTELIPPDKEPGWVVPAHLRGRWQLHLGDARELLPRLLPTLGPIDVFVHDSLHTYDHMMFEYRTAWPYLRKGGILMSDDIDANSAFSDFAGQVRCSYARFHFRPSANSVGAMRKAGS